MRRAAQGAAAACLALAAAGCGGLASAPPPARPAPPAPAVKRIDPLVERVARAPVPELISRSLRRRAEEMVVRVRNVSCEGIATGSGFALDAHTLLTNRHVLAGASQLEVSTWDGHDLAVSTAEVGALVDLGVASVDGTLPRAASSFAGAVAGEAVTVVGFPLGGPLTLSRGRVVDLVAGARLGVPGPVLRLTADVRPGNSGGPVLDGRGRVVGIVYGIELSTGYGLAIPLDTLRKLVAAGGFEAVPPCGSE
ncbi:MAG TPA: trypsin-like peptidase domain-containing protein [Gaiellaceae bacterium]|nr:trypsin-like peptidase domain-containing protein [Gaiellaceae bacterium]